MNTPEIIAVPVLMLADYTLTILGAKEAAAVYRKHFVLASYELNPLWRQSVDQIRWFNPRHFFLVCLVTALLIAIDQYPLPGIPIEFPLGMLYCVWGMICGRHLSNLLIFRFVNRHPEVISGEVQLSMRFGLKVSQYTHIGLAPLFIANAFLTPSEYSTGMAVGAVLIAFVHSIWAWRTRGSEPQRSKQGPGAT